ncbi:MAG: hypothetical protein ACLS5E_11980 [[Ruminococcus] lactaris]
MKFHSFLIKYGEIGIKGKNRYLFEDALVQSDAVLPCRMRTENFTFTNAMGRVYVDCEGEYDYEETVDSTEKGLWHRWDLSGCSCSGGLRTGGTERKMLYPTWIRCIRIKIRTFKVEARRRKKSVIRSILWKLTVQLGEAILRCISGDSVSMCINQRCEIECRNSEKKIYIYSEIIPGPGGMPVGTNGKCDVAICQAV